MLREIRTFVAVAETGSIKAAARRLRLTQPAITRQIQRLESALGTAVLDWARAYVARTGEAATVDELVAFIAERERRS